MLYVMVQSLRVLKNVVRIEKWKIEVYEGIGTFNFSNMRLMTVNYDQIKFRREWQNVKKIILGDA